MTSSAIPRAGDGYRHDVGPGPRVRTDVIDLYVFQRRGAGARAPEAAFASPDRASTTGYGMGGESFGGGGAERDEAWFLQLRRAKSPLDGTWQPVMGHIESPPPGAPAVVGEAERTGGATIVETAPRCAIREAREEIGLEIPSGDAVGFWALEQVHPFYIAAIECIVMSPRFAVEVRAGWAPKLNHEHAAHRWVRACEVGQAFVWPGQRAAIREIVEHLLPADSLSREHLRIKA